MARLPFGVVDLFAGPGGLAEGFSKVTTTGSAPAFRIELSVEKETHAHRTLQLRSFLRQFPQGFPPLYYDWLAGGAAPDWSKLYPNEWREAEREALQLTLGSDEAAATLHPRLADIRQRYGDRTVVIGGPPCQAYSLVGRARNRGKIDYVFEEDARHELYKSYVDVLKQIQPAAFVMENVKGLLSSQSHGASLFSRVLDDLRSAGGKPNSYRLVALAPRSLGSSQFDARDFVVRAEEHGVPQARHRLIVVGLRHDIAARAANLLDAGLLMTPKASGPRVRDVIGQMPKLRSGLSRQEDDSDIWNAVALDALRLVRGLGIKENREWNRAFGKVADAAIQSLLMANRTLPRSDRSLAGFSETCPQALQDWLADAKLTALPNHESRGHMRADIARYAFAALFVESTGRSPKAADFPDRLAPKHHNWNSGKFADRFKVQGWESPASTVTSHISKDGHYYIHPDATQCRSLTVREAARLQTFPDNYLFLGNRTEQYIQVGNAVPPYLAFQIGKALLRIIEDT